jgi:methylated-DNA-[protein]-cysteine S-methyltransferase
MQIMIKYTIFRTKWGHFGLAGTEKGLLRTCLPLSSPEKAKSQLLTALEAPRFEKRLFKTAQDQITSYFEGTCVNFADIPIILDGLGDFCNSVLTACRGIKFGQVVTYSTLAKKINRPTASRAIGNALAKNPLPLIIPCHRIIRSNGQLGGFSAPGGTNTKAKLLQHEQLTLRGLKIK